MRLECQDNQLKITFQPKTMTPFAMSNINSDNAPINPALRTLETPVFTGKQPRSSINLFLKVPPQAVFFGNTSLRMTSFDIEGFRYNKALIEELVESHV